MVWLLLLHISAVVCWCGSLLYLFALTAGVSSQSTPGERQHHLALILKMFGHLATPAALIAIISGTALFMTAGITSHWLIIKLTLVTALVLCHAAGGWIILNAEKSPASDLTLPCTLSGLTVVLLIPAIIWVVLTKPYNV